MGWVNKVLGKLKFSDDVEPKRRVFLKGAAGLATIAAVGGVGLSFRTLTETEEQRFMRMVESGLVQDQLFVLTEPVTIISDKELTINRCTFILKGNFNSPAFRVEGPVRITNCAFGLRKYAFAQVKNG